MADLGAKGASGSVGTATGVSVHTPIAFPSGGSSTTAYEATTARTATSRVLQMTSVALGAFREVRLVPDNPILGEMTEGDYIAGVLSAPVE